MFSSSIFLFIFLPIFLGLYYLTPFKLRSSLILLGSYAFYAWWRIDFLVLLAGITVVAYGFALQIEKTQDARAKFRLLSVAITLNLLALAYFKYANFGVTSLNAALEKLGVQALAWTPVILPIGLSFFIFHAISYLVDIYRHEARPTQNIIDFAAFIALFPHLIAGPVLRYHLLAEQFRSRVHSWDRFARGATRFMLGFTKKVLLADTVAPLADAMFLLEHPTLSDAWLGVLAYTMQIFFDFSGYSDMAIGLALMIGFEFPENFWHPYISRSITEFWRRWHISLSSWLREYLYIPLGGNRYGTARTYFNLTTTMVLGGLVARRKLDVCDLGRMARRYSGTRACPQRSSCAAESMVDNSGHDAVGGDRLGVFSQRKCRGCNSSFERHDWFERFWSFGCAGISNQWSRDRCPDCSVCGNLCGCLVGISRESGSVELGFVVDWRAVHHQSLENARPEFLAVFIFSILRCV